MGKSSKRINHSKSANNVQLKGKIEPIVQYEIGQAEVNFYAEKY